MNENGRIGVPSHWVSSVLISLVIGVGSLGVQWGTLGQRTSNLETALRLESQERRDLQTTVFQEIHALEEKNAIHDTKIAVIDDKLDTIITQLATISGQLRQSSVPMVLPPKSTARN